MGLLKLAINRQSKSLVDFEGTAVSIPALFQGDTQPFEISILDPTGQLQNPYAKVDVGSLTLRVSVGQTPTGTAGGPTPLALQTTWTWDSTNQQFEGEIALNTAGITSFIGTASERTAYFEVKLDDGGELDTVLQLQFTLKAVVDENATEAPALTETFLTFAQSDARYVKFANNTNGATIRLRSPNGTYELELGCNDDGSVKMDVITL